MRKFLLGVLLLPALALAEPVKVEKEVVCDATKEMLPFFVKKYGETPLWMGDADGSSIVLLANAATQTWSVVQFNKDVACLIDSGKGFKFKLPGEPT